MRTTSFTYAPSVLDADGICASQTTAGAAYANINGALASGGVATMGDQQFITIFSASNLSGLTFLATGTDKNGTAITSSITGPGAGLTVVSTKNFYMVSSVYVSGAAAAFTIGVNGLGASVAYPTDVNVTPFQLSVAVVSVTGATYKLQYTYDNVQDPTWPNGTQYWFDSALMTGETAATDVSINASPVTAVRLSITSAGSPQSLTGRIVQAGPGR